MVQNFLEKSNAKDASGNIILGDIGVHIQQEVRDVNYHEHLRFFQSDQLIASQILCSELIKLVKLLHSLFILSFTYTIQLTSQLGICFHSV